VRLIERHPEELLDREAAGVLGATERVALDAHAARCAACQCERRLRLSFVEALRDPPQLRLALPRAEAPRAMVRPPAPAPGPVSCTRPSPRARRGGVGWLMAVALYAAFATSIAAADADGPIATMPASEEAERAAVARTVERIGALAASMAARRAAAPVRHYAARAMPAVTGADVTAVSAESLFEEANRARRRRDYETAVVMYRRLQARHPASREARLSYVTMGRMQLDRADALGALASFERYERSGDVELDDVAMAGRALALDNVGSSVAPRAWLALLRAHPESPYASHARLRARNLGGDPDPAL
jgi:hypothetical protein